MDWRTLETRRTLTTGASWGLRGHWGQEDLWDKRTFGTRGPWGPEELGDPVNLIHTLETVSQGPSDLGYHVRIFDMRLGTQRTQWTSYLGDLRNLKTWRTLGTEEPWGPGDLGDRISWCSYCRGHGLRTPHEGINQRNLKIWADVADKICFHRNYKFGIGIWFSAVQWRRFRHRASVVCGRGHRIKVFRDLSPIFIFAMPT